MKISIITPNRNGDRYLGETLSSVDRQHRPGIEIEHIVVDALSGDASLDIIRRFEPRIRLIREKDKGPANAINKGLTRASGDVLAWLNADDYYEPDALKRVAQSVGKYPRAALFFGRCRIVNEKGDEIRHSITRFKECFFPLSSRFTIQAINYISQPAMFFRRDAFEKAGPLREDLRAAWDYELILRLWRQGGAVRVPGPPLAAFRWHEQSISGRHFRRQFTEELAAAAEDAGRFAPQTLLHRGVRAGIIAIYSAMARNRRKSRMM